jgi:hypothetical protein
MGLKSFLGLVIFVLFLILINLNFSSATNCWMYTTNSTCFIDTDCTWKSDNWGSYCQEYNCWNFNTQSDCINARVPNKNCTWQAGGVNYGCEKLSCGSLSGTNESACTNNSAGLNCEWQNYCYQGGIGNLNCWQQQNQSSCMNLTGCLWGNCMEKGCQSYNINTTCNAAKDWNGKNCTWNTNNYCEQNGCWKYYNQSDCSNIEVTKGLNCGWKYNSCQDVDCYSWDFTNESACVNNSVNLSCSWTGSYCNKKDCWNYNTQSSCQDKPGCLWKVYVSSGWCNEVNCWTWDFWNSGSQQSCEGNGTLYGLGCIWSIDSMNSSRGWCYKDVSSVSCSNITTEKTCMDTFYCWWQYTDWNNVSKGGTCNIPGSFGGGGGGSNSSILNNWNPNCYIFDMNLTDCNYVLGCNYSNSKCVQLDNVYGRNITEDGINCSFINDSNLCNNIGVLSSCCSWQNGNCTQNKMSSSCRDQMQQPSEGASFCEDYNAFTSQLLCEQIAGKPWYMPCIWDNSSERCKFDSDDVFGNDTQSLMKINNKKNCESASGKWISENYCEGNISVPTGRCEYKFDEETNCDKSCFACEIKDSNGNSVNSTNAESACLGSKLGFCEFVLNTNAPNSIGFCKAKEQFKKGIAGNCNDNCGDCTFKGDKNNNDTTKRPSYYCTASKANSAGGGCKWITDNSTTQGGYCVDKGEKTCEDSCDRCNSQNDCSNLGRTSIANQSGSCKWEGDSNTGNCGFNIGEDVEICWDGIDNTDDNLIDCADPSCYTDDFCGFVEGNCFGWTTNATCVSNDCEWITDQWGSFCDFKGSRCWKLNQNNSICNNNTNCQWSNGTGNGWCERDWSTAEICMGLNRTGCTSASASGCEWTNDTWCSGTGSGSAWCQDQGGWCDHTDFKPKNCWSYQSGLSECNNHSGCSWKIDSFSQPHCEVNWGNNCWNYTSNSSCSNAGCWWKTDSWGSWCTNVMDKCWSSINQSSCNSQTNNDVNICSWTSSGGNWDSCQPLCFSPNLNSLTCGAVTGCMWKSENGWCEENAMAACTATNTSNNATNCSATLGCKWKNSGWCDPKNGGFSAATTSSGGGAGGAMGSDCFKYDGNQTLCTNKSLINISCGWFVEPNPRCEVNWASNCWQYGSAEAGCNSTNECWWKTDSYGSFCTNIMDQCWQNQSYQSWNNIQWAENCSANPLCMNNSLGCQPKCMNESLNSLTCIAGNLAGKCKYVTGWCNSAGMNQMFDNMESGAPLPLGGDDCPESGKQASVDICGFGMKDMGDAYGFGSFVNNFENASICNKEKLSSNVMGMIGGGGSGFGSSLFGNEKIGSGNESIIYVVYLDTDGSTTSGCALSHNSSAVGYEFRFKYTSRWNSSLSKAVETLNADKCDDSSWKATDIKLSAWKKMMCSEIGGPMIAVEKAALAKYPSLYNSTKDMRVYVAMIGNSGNITDVTDSAGPSWTTPGSIDFEIVDAFSYGANTAKFEDILKKGFVQYEDCYNSIDDDGDGNVDCNDWNCEYSSNCEGDGVNDASYVDTTSPRVTGVKIEEYPDATLIIYDTNKPTNGSLDFYSDDRCLNRTNIIYDIGIMKNSTMREYKLWHYGMIYETNDSVGGYNVSINWPLAANATYYYKLGVCDSGGKCAVSKCSSFKTAVSLAKCSYCNFVTKIKPPTGWEVSYDVNRDGTYEHIQGEVCGPNAGMKTNYSSGRKVNVKLAKSDGSAYFEFLNVTLTKTSLNDKVRTISSSGDIISDTNKIGLPSGTRDKIINNLHPEVCRVKIPVASGAVCDKLYHCNDDGENCVDKTSVATLVDSVNCVWTAPYCEFSTYKTSDAPGGGNTGSSGGGGSGSGGGKTIVSLSEAQLKEGYTKYLSAGSKLGFNISGEQHILALDTISSNSIIINISSVTQQATFKVGDEKKFDVNVDEYYDIIVKLNSLNSTTGIASITIKGINEKISEAVSGDKKISEEKEQDIQEFPEEKNILTSNNLNWLLFLIIVIIIVLVVGYIIYKKNAKK